MFSANLNTFAMHNSGIGLPHSKTLARYPKGLDMAARFWSAAALCRFHTAYHCNQAPDAIWNE
jgi:hypothetical protein